MNSSFAGAIISFNKLYIGYLNTTLLFYEWELLVFFDCVFKMLLNISLLEKNEALQWTFLGRFFWNVFTMMDDSSIIEKIVIENHIGELMKSLKLVDYIWANCSFFLEYLTYLTKIFKFRCNLLSHFIV